MTSVTSSEKACQTAGSAGRSGPWTTCRPSADNEAEHPLSVAPERRTAVRRRLQADLERYLRHAAACESPLEPGELELGFGFAEGDERGEPSELPVVELGGVKLRGRIDRVDL